MVARIAVRIAGECPRIRQHHPDHPVHACRPRDALRFLTETLGFVVRHCNANYACVEREGAAIRMLEHDDSAEIGVPHRGFAYYIDGRDPGPGARRARSEAGRTAAGRRLRPSRPAVQPARADGPRARRQPHGIRAGDRTKLTLSGNGRCRAPRARPPAAPGRRSPAHDRRNPRAAARRSSRTLSRRRPRPQAPARQSRAA